MKIAICTGITYPSKMANRVHILSMTKAFADAGHEVFLFAKEIKGYEYTNVELFSINKIVFISAYLQLKKIKEVKSDFIYTRDPKLWAFIMLYNKFWFRLDIPVIYEIHDIPRSTFEKLSLKSFGNKVKKIITITKGLKDDLVQNFRLNKDSIIVLPDGVDMEMFQNIDEREVEALYKKHNIPKGRKNILYSGHLYPWKGVDTLAETAKLIPEYNFIFIGGWEKGVKVFKEKYGDIKNIYILGHVPHEEVPKYLQLADVFVLPNSKKEMISKKYTSPLKMFEYMASKKPIVASDLPSIREILKDGENAFLVKPDNSQILAEKIKQVLAASNVNEVFAKAHRDVCNYTWSQRAKEILMKITEID